MVILCIIVKFSKSKSLVNQRGNLFNHLDREDQGTVKLVHNWVTQRSSTTQIIIHIFYQQFCLEQIRLLWFQGLLMWIKTWSSQCNLPISQRSWSNWIEMSYNRLRMTGIPWFHHHISIFNSIHKII